MKALSWILGLFPLYYVAMLLLAARFHWYSVQWVFFAMPAFYILFILPLSALYLGWVRGKGIISAKAFITLLLLIIAGILAFFLVMRYNVFCASGCYFD